MAVEAAIPEAPVSRLTAASDRITASVGTLAAGVAGLLLLSNLVVVFSSVIARYFFNSPFAWSDEVARACLVALAFFGGTVALARREHLGLSILVNRLPPRAAAFAEALRACMLATFAGAFVWTGWEAIPLSRAETTASGLSESIFYWPMLFAGIGMAVIASSQLLRLRFVPLASAGVLVAGVVAAWWLLAGVSLPNPSGAAAPVMFLVIVIALLIGLPIGFALGLGAIAFVLIDGTLPVALVADRMEAGVDSFVLLAVPFFIFAGFLMDAGGVSAHLVYLVQLLLGRVRGGIGIVTIVSMYLFSGVSGSKTGDIAAVGSLLMPAYRERKQEAEGMAVLAASAAMGETIPPSIVLLVMASLANLSVAALFIAGVIPAAVIALALAVLVIFKVPQVSFRSEGLPRSRGEQLKALGGSLMALLMPLMILLGILLGVATPTEVSSFAVVYALVLCGVGYRTLSLRQTMRLAINAAVVTGVLLFIFATATMVAWVVTVQQYPQALTRLIIDVSGGHGSWLFLLLTIFTVVVMGSILEGAPALVVFVPLFFPVASSLGINLVHYGIVLIIAMGIGVFAPPLGIGLYAACAVGKVTVEQVARPLLKYLVVVGVGLLIVAYVPAITLWLPRAFGLIS